MIKKCILFVMLFATLPAFAYFEPDWSEFCPPKYANLSTSKKYFWAEKKYWLNRRLNFEKNKSYCETQKNKENCFAELRQSELNKNQIYFSQLQIDQQRANTAIMNNSINSLRY